MAAEWEVVTVCSVMSAVVGAVGAWIAAVIGRSPNKQKNGDVMSRAPHLVPGLADVCKVHTEDMQHLATTCVQINAGLSRLEEKVQDNREVLTERIEGNRRSIDSMKSDLSNQFGSLREEVRKFANGGKDK